MTKKTYDVPAVDKTLDILEYLKNHPQASLTQIHQDLGFPKSTTYGILYTLEKRGYIRKGISSGFKLGFKLYELGNISVEGTDFIKEAQPIMESLAHKTGLTCNLGVLEGDVGVYLEKVQPPSPIQLNSWRGKTIPLHCTALGKVLLAYKDVKEILEILDRLELTKNTEKTITDKELLLSELLQVKQKGFAIDAEEHEDDITCLAAPVFDYTGKIVAAISISSLTTWLNDDNKGEIINNLISAAQQISKRIGSTV